MSLPESNPRYQIYKEDKSVCEEKNYIAVKKLGYDINKELCNPELIVRVGAPEGDTKNSVAEISKESKKKSQATLKRRNRRNKLKSLRTVTLYSSIILNKDLKDICNNKSELNIPSEIGNVKDHQITTTIEHTKMSDSKARDSVLAARQAKKLAKQKGKTKDTTEVKNTPADVNTVEVENDAKPVEQGELKSVETKTLKSKDEVDKVSAKVDILTVGENNKDQIKAERAAKKALKQQAKKKDKTVNEIKVDNTGAKNIPSDNISTPINQDMTVKDVVETLRDIAAVAKDIKDVTEKPADKKAGDSGKSKAELRAERRAKQEAQRAAKQAVEEKANAKSKEVLIKSTVDRDSPNKDVNSTKLKAVDKLKVKSQSSHRVNWFQHLYKDVENESLRSIPINSHLHPAIIKLGVQLASRVVTGSNARCIALLDALKKMVRDYTLPAKTEFARGLESHLVSSLAYLWASRPPSASQENAVKFFRYHLTQLPNNVDEFDAKKTLQEEIDRYIREQIDMAGEAISITVRNKISKGDNILTYGCSSLIERILREAWVAGVQFRTVVVGSRLGAGGAGRGGGAGGAEMARRLAAAGLPVSYVDITGLSAVIHTVDKVVLGAGALLGNGSVLGAAGGAQVALAARARNVPVLVACETHKFCDRVQTDAFVYNEIGDPDDLIDTSDENSPLKDWRSNQNLTPLNLLYDVTPASLVTAVVTELAILPCTSAPVVLRFKLSEYGV